MFRHAPASYLLIMLCALAALIACVRQEATPLPTVPAIQPATSPPRSTVQDATALPTHTPTPATVQAPSRSVHVAVDPRVELLATVVRLSGHDLCGAASNTASPPQTAYEQAVFNTFARYEQHEAIQRYRALAENGFTCDAPPTLMLHLSPPPELRVETPFTPYLLGRAGGEEPLLEFIAALRDFADASQYMRFFAQHTSDFAAWVAATEQQLGSYNDMSVLEDYYGVQQHQYAIILAPLLPDHAYGPRIERADDTFDVYSILGRMAIDTGQPTFGTAENLRFLVWHEFSHSFVNPLTEQFHEHVGQLRDAYLPIAEQMRQQGYSTWETAVNEHIVRAVTTRLAYRQLGTQAGDNALRYEQQRGFVYVERLTRKLVEYEQHRDQYPSLETFYPVLLNVFKE